MIGYWHHSVVCPSVRPSVKLYIKFVALRVGVGVESCTVVFLINENLKLPVHTTRNPCMLFTVRADKLRYIIIILHQL